MYLHFWLKIMKLDWLKITKYPMNSHEKQNTSRYKEQGRSMTGPLFYTSHLNSPCLNMKCPCP
jgi:hypothetical protein